MGPPRGALLLLVQNGLGQLTAAEDKRPGVEAANSQGHDPVASVEICDSGGLGWTVRATGDEKGLLLKVEQGAEEVCSNSCQQWSAEIWGKKITDRWRDAVVPTRWLTCGGGQEFRY